MGKGMLIDVTKCIGCKGCQVACKQWNNLPATKTSFNADWSNPPELTGTNFTRVQHHFIEEGDTVKWRFVKTGCMHCEEPACESACFVHAFVKSKQGPVVYKENLCVGCRYCMIACPFWVPKYEWNKRFPLVRKCDMCPERQEAGMEPACVTACTTGAIKFGEREELLQEARARIKANPSKYVEHIYGEKEVGGTSILYLADVPFEKLGFKTDLTTEALPQYTWKALSKIPYVLVGWGALLTAMYFYNKRRGDLNGHDEHKAS